jgi:hypothetical protein
VSKDPVNNGKTSLKTIKINSVLVRDDLPELRADLVAALATLDADDLTHGC